jgi:hypothetical protein
MVGRGVVVVNGKISRVSEVRSIRRKEWSYQNCIGWHVCVSFLGCIAWDSGILHFF